MNNELDGEIGNCSCEVAVLKVTKVKGEENELARAAASLFYDMAGSRKRRRELKKAHTDLRADSTVMWTLGNVRQEITIEELTENLEVLSGLQEVRGEVQSQAIAKMLEGIRRLAFVVPECWTMRISNMRTWLRSG